MPPAARRLSIALLPVEPDAPTERIQRTWDRLGSDGWLDPTRGLVVGGFRSARLETHREVRFYANWQGGFRVYCPVSAALITEVFAGGLERWRAGHPRFLSCPCGAEHDLAALAFAPEAGFARGVIWLHDVGSPDLCPDALPLLAHLLEGLRVVLRRG